MKGVLSTGAGEDHYVIQVDKDKPVQEILENVIDKCLEHCWGISEVEWHDQVFE